jgi:hypothetical protein
LTVPSSFGAEVDAYWLTFEGDLVGDLLYDVQGQAGALPLLQFTLDQLFQRRKGRQLTTQAYREIGGVKGPWPIMPRQLMLLCPLKTIEDWRVPSSYDWLIQGRRNRI